MRALLFALGFILTGCMASVLPDRPASLSDYIPQPEEVFVEEDFDFAETRFPESCSWYDLQRVVDGDTITVRENIKVRFVGVDTPEIKHPTKGLEPFGLEASQRTKDLLHDQDEICIIQDGIGDMVDRYGRMLGYIFTRDGVDINATLVREGYAKGYFSFPFERENEFRFYHDEAKAAARGLWGD
jgi:Micrococcal nuclease (thermonuclease) homologs